MNFVQRQMLQNIASRQDVKLSTSQAKFLAEGYKEEKNCLFSFLLLPMNLVVNLVIKPSKRMLRKITIILAVKESADMLSLFVHQAILTDYCARHGLLVPPQMSSNAINSREGKEIIKKQLFQIARIVNKTCKAMDTRLLNQTLKRILSSSKLLILITYTAFARWIRQARKALKRGEEFEEQFNANINAHNEKLDDLIDQIFGELMLRENYFQQLVHEFAKNYAAREEDS